MFLCWHSWLGRFRTSTLGPTTWKLEAFRVFQVMLSLGQMLRISWNCHLEIGTLCYTCCMRDNKVKKIHLQHLTTSTIHQNCTVQTTCYTLRCFMGFWASNYDARSLGLATSTHPFLPHEFHLLAALALSPQNQPTCSNCNGRWKMEWVWERGAYWTIRIISQTNSGAKSVLELALIQQFVMANRVRLGDIAQPHLDHQLV